MKQVLPIRAWHLLRVASVLFALAVIVLLVAAPDAGLKLWWGFVVPVLPLMFFVIPGVWRNICPMAALNQTPRLFGFTRGLTLPPWLKEYGYVAGIALFLVLIASRKALFNDSGPATAALLAAALGVAFVGGLVFKGKSGWCSSGVCPLFPVQRIYGQTPFAVVPNSHCQPCVGCAKNCYDFNPRVAYLADMADEDPRYSGYRKFFAGAFPGAIVAFYTVANPPEISTVRMYGEFAVYILASAGLFYLLDRFVKVSSAKLTALFAAAAFNLYYWYNIPLMSERIFGSEPEALVWGGRALVLALTLLWLSRTYLKERLYLAQGGAARLPKVAAAAGASIALRGSIALRRGQRLGEPEVVFQPEGKRVVAQSGRTLLEVAEAHGQKIEAGCRLGVCGADPIAVLAGMDGLSQIDDDERNTLERLGFASNTRMACKAHVHGDCAIALKPERPKAFASSVLRGFQRDPSVERVVVIGNGIAGVTAADHVRRRHPGAEIHLIAREKHHLYNRMGIERLIYGRSAMAGLYLQEEQWYEDLQITTWLNTRVVRIDRAARQVILGTGETVPYDRLILATGSSAMVPPIEGFGLPGAVVMREADDALAIRAFAQEHACPNAIVAGGGLLGLEAAYALHKLGTKVAVLERSEWLLRRQLDQRGAAFLQEYLEGLGLAVITRAETAAVQGEARVQRVVLKDGRTLPCDIFLVAAGITPNVELARDAGLEVKRGVVVDDALRTSDPAIYAAGDVAEHRGTVHGLWPAASEQAQIAAANALGDRKLYEPAPSATMLKVVGVELTSIGRIEPAEGDTVIALEETEAHRYRKLVIADGQLVGAILFGHPLLSPAVTSAVKKNADVSGCLDALRAGNWEVLATLEAGAARDGGAAAARAPVQPIPAAPAAAAPPPASPPPSAGRVEPAPVVIPAVRPADRQRAAARISLRGEGDHVQGVTYTVDRGGATLGRVAENTIVIPDTKLSRQHARIDFRDGEFWITDLESTNGTFVNYQRLTAPHPLQSGDVIGLGGSRLIAEVNRDV
jgi:NADPH-dependent 2,4-dienoyl-CoA reductase/sulfur reductase-like enzyme/ferredoxin